MLTAIQAGRDAYNHADSGSGLKRDVGERQARRDRAKAICEALGGRMKAEGWVGKVEAVEEIKNLVGMRLGRRGVSLDIGQRAAVEIQLDKKDPAYDDVATLDKGQLVSFSGSFVSDDGDCVQVDSVTMRGRMVTPDFQFRFTEIEPLD